MSEEHAYSKNIVFTMIHCKIEKLEMLINWWVKNHIFIILLHVDIFFTFKILRRGREEGWVML